MAQLTTSRATGQQPTRVSPAKDSKELQALKAYMREITSSKDKAETFLRQAGVIDKQGRLAKQYRP